LEVCALAAALIITIVLFARVKRQAAFLLIPYLAWTSFAAFLNFTIWRLNR
jgi:tryptophan-rich sensory protein